MREVGLAPGYALPGMLSFALAVASFFPQGDDVSAWLDRLRADSAAERSRAQRWLGTHLAEGDLDLVRRAAIDGDAETRARLVLALADADAHLEIAASLAASSEESAAAVGRNALADRIADWAPGWTARGLDREEALSKLREEAGRVPGSSRVIAIDPRGKDNRLDLALEELARIAPEGLALVLDPDLLLSDHPREPEPEVEGVFDRVLNELVRIHRADLEGFDFPEAVGAPARPWIRIGRARSSNRPSAAAHVAAWCEELAGGGDPKRRAACARAIASTGWPGGLAWLERRWRARSDDAALEGVLLAAGRGLVAPSLADPEVQRGLYRSMDALAGGGLAETSRADAIARAIAAAGPRGEDLAALAVEGLLDRSPREQWLRLVAVEGMQPVSAGAASAIDALLASPNVQLPVRFQALRARAAIRGAGPDVPKFDDARGLLAWARAAKRGEECTRLLIRLGIEPPSGTPAEPAREELEWIFFAGGPQAAGRALLAVSAPDDQGGLGLEAMSNRTRTWVLRGSRPRFDAAIAAARSLPGTDAGRLDRLEILSAAGSAELRARVLERTSSPSTREDLLVLGALGAGAGGERARDVLIRSLTAYAPLEDVIAALDLALACVRAARDDLAERSWIQAVRKAAREGPPTLRARFGVDAWPTQERPEVVRGWEGDRSLERSSLP